MGWFKKQQISELDARQESLPSKNAEKLAAAKQMLGKKWVLHPEYEKQEAHTYQGSYVLDKFQAKQMQTRGLI